MKEKFVTLIRQNILIFFVVFIAAFLRFSNLSPWLEDWDSVQFALGLHNFSITEHQPHAPGYLLYIALGKLALLIFQDDTKALTTLSAALGSLSILPLYFLTKRIFNQMVAILASVIFAITPIGWMMSEVALTNMPGLFFLLIFAYLVFTSFNQPRKLILTSIFGGLILGVRFTEFPVIISLLGLAFLWHRQLKTITLSIIAFIAGIFSWLIPLVVITGPKPFIESYTWIANYVLRHDTQLSSSITLATFLKTRLSSLWELLQIGYTPYFIFLGLIGLTVSIITKNGWRRWPVQFVFVWVISYFIPLSLVYNLEVPRYTLPLLPPLAITTAYLFAILIKRTKVVLLFLLIFTAVIFSQSWSQVTRFNRQIPPTIQPVKFVKQNFDPKNTVIIATITYRQFQYYAPEYKIYYADKIDKVAVQSGTTVILDYLKSKDKVDGVTSFQDLKTQEFNGSRDIFTRVPSTTIFALKGEY